MKNFFIGLVSTIVYIITHMFLLLPFTSVFINSSKLDIYNVLQYTLLQTFYIVGKEFLVIRKLFLYK